MLDGAFQVPEPLRGNVTFLLRVAGERASEILDAELAALGLNSRQLSILLLAEGELLNQNTIAAATQTHPNAVVSLLDSLEQKGLAKREQNPANRREYLVRITPQGRKVLKNSGNACSNAFARLMERLTDDERLQLTRLLLKLIEAWA